MHPRARVRAGFVRGARRTCIDIFPEIARKTRTSLHANALRNWPKALNFLRLNELLFRDYADRGWIEIECASPLRIPDDSRGTFADRIALAIGGNLRPIDKEVYARELLHLIISSYFYGTDSGAWNSI